MTPKLIWKSIGSIKAALTDLESLLEANGIKNLAKTCPFTIDQIKHLYEIMVNQSWSKSKDFELFQAAWNIIASKWNVVGNNIDNIRFKDNKTMFASMLASSCIDELKDKFPVNENMYVLSSYVDHEDSDVIAVYSTREKAEDAAKIIMESDNHIFGIIKDNDTVKSWKYRDRGYIIHKYTIDEKGL